MATKEETLIQFFKNTNIRETLSAIGVSPSNKEINMLEEIMSKHKLNNEVMNVILDFVIMSTNGKLPRGYIETICFDIAKRGIEDAKSTMQHFREHMKKLRSR